MIKIDGGSSFLYDISRHGNVTRTTGYYYGSAFIDRGVTVEKGVNDKLLINVNCAGIQTINLLNEDETFKTFSSSELISRLNDRFESQGVSVQASLNGKSLMLRSQFYGDGSSVQVIQTAYAYNDLFTREDTIYYSPSIIDGKKNAAQLKGNYYDKTLLQFDNTNNSFYLV